jgi:hypothetical protein
VRTVLVSLPSGAGVVRLEDGSVLITNEVSDGGGTHLRADDPFHPAKSWVDDSRSVVGGLLPPAAVSVEVVDDRGARIDAAVAGGAYVAVLEQPNDGHEPVVCCRDATGSPVRRPLPADYPSTPVDDADVPCPACGAIDYEECVPTDSWRGGRPGPDGAVIPNPIVVCRRCGQEERVGTFFAAASSAEEEEDEATRETRMARARASARVHRWYSTAMTLRALTFPIYAAVGWPVLIGASGSRADQLTSLAIDHYDTPDPDPYSGDQPRFEVTTSSVDEHVTDPLSHARWTLASLLSRDGPAEWPDASHAAITLWLAARDRGTRATVLDAVRSEQPINLDGSPQAFLMCTAATGHWVAVRHHEDLVITVAARDLDPTTITLEPIPDPAARLLGPEPPDAKDWPW